MNKYDIIIEGSNIILREYKYQKSVSIENFAKAFLEKKQTFETKQLPPNCIKFQTNNTLDIYYIYIPEDFYTLFEGDRFKEGSKLYTVRLPNSIFKFVFQKDTCLLFSGVETYWTEDEKIDLVKSRFFAAMLPNVYNSGAICIGGSANGGKNQVEWVENFIKIFFTSKFNQDLAEGKHSIARVSSAQKNLLSKGIPPHDLIKVWWYRFSPENELGTELPRRYITL